MALSRSGRTPLNKANTSPSSAARRAGDIAAPMH
jgi:hypothetical protein